jgi:hypothetical protein
MLIEQLKKLEDSVLEREESFLKHFVTGDTLLGLNGIWFGSENIRFYYIAWEGTHVVEIISWEEFNKWLGNK